MKVGSIFRLLALVLLIALLLRPETFAGLFALFAGPRQPPIYNQGSLLELTLNHLAIVGAAILASTLVAVGLGVLVTRPIGAEFLPLSRALAQVGQTFPPVAVLAIAVPVLGFGTAPTFVALFLYGLLPIFENTLAGLTNLPPKVTDAAKGMGMTGWQRLLSVDLPLALPVILAGVRLSTVISLGTATIGSTVAARTLGEVIIAGLLSANTAFVLQGGLIVGLLAVLIHDGFSALERLVLARNGQAGAAAG
ncbi:ABC transporter permease [Rubellimicrobium rubrum]|uniref:ABC transporter permease n=1 Tax=Rubellimicrobium rubrum TaxID=2585369 RepID=A0A5C4MWE2_9RHOB|nr:ABC transporter permease [Rubellimicrobium rubrum]TNC48437.1 ABC transporter permease [Rubellimicrobium rubrum]